MPPDTNQPNQQPQQQPGPPLFGGPFPQPVQPAVVTPPSQPTPPASNGAGKTWLIASLIGGVLLIIIVVVVMVLAASDNSKTATDNKTVSDSTKSDGPSAATSASVQYVNDSISQDISSLNDDKDFPADKLSDQKLGL